MRGSDIEQRTPNATHISDPNAGAARLRGFTLVELLVVIVIIALLTSMLAPSIQIAVEQARRSDCRKRLQNLHGAAFMYASENRNLVPLIHEGTSYGMVGRILASGGRFANKYMGQSWRISGQYAVTSKADNVFQCPSALQNPEGFNKNQATNYSLSGFGLNTGAGVGLHPNTMVIGGTVQSKGAGHPAGEVAMATDWIWSRSSSNGPNGASLANHPKGANVLYGSGTAKWVNYSAMIPVGTGGMIVPPGTYGFVKSGVGGTEIYDPEGSTISSNTGGDRKPGAGIMW